jgi:hypothetical protein
MKNSLCASTAATESTSSYPIEGPTMNTPETTDAAWMLRVAIETQRPEPVIGEWTLNLVAVLGGTADARLMTPGTAALYILSLYLSRPQ